MRTRRQAKIEANSTSVSPAQKKDQMIRGHKKESDNVKDGKKPSKRVKKDQAKSPPVSPQVQRAGRGRKKKELRISDKNQEKENSKDKVKQNKDKKRSSSAQQEKKQERKSEAKNKSQNKQRRSDNEDKQKSQEKQDKKKSKSPSPDQVKRKKVKPQKQEEIKKVVVKGAAPVDEYFDRGKDFHVLVHNNKVYSATLNQTNISNNNNKYYNLQILQSDKNPGINYFMTRWGRVGTPGQKSIVGPVSVNVAISEFNTKFHEKHKKGQYRQLQMNYGDEQEQQKKDQSNQNAGQKDPQKTAMTDYQESKLPKATKDLINLIFDIGMMNKQMKQIGYNVNKMPLGKLTKDNIKLGYNILKKLYDEIEHKKREDVMEQLTNDFYSYIPHDVGFRNMRLYKLDTLKKVKEKLEMLESLTEIKIATQILKDQDQGNAIDNNYKKLNRNITVIEKDSFTYKLINDYLQSTHAKTHGSYDLELVDLFEVDSEMERNRYTNDIQNKMLLWHGSRLTNFVGILSQGLRIAPPEAPVTGYMFGKGVYFADMSSKSANYCFTSPQNNTGILILCEVALGNCNQKMHADYLASNLPDGKHSTKGVGKTAPKIQNFQSLDGVTIPMGPGFSTDITGCSLLYNEFIVYKIEQIKIRYLLRTKFNYKKVPGY